MEIIANNAVEYAAKCEKLFETMAEESGYTRISTFYSDLSIAEWYDKKSIQETYDNVCKHWISDYKMFTEFVMSLNYKSWQWYKTNEDLSRLYADLYYKAYDYALDHFESQDAKTYFLETLD